MRGKDVHGRFAEPIRVLVCEPSAVVRRGLAQLLAGDEGISVVAEASSDEHVVAVAEEAGVSVAIGDPDHLGAEAVSALVGNGVRVLLVSSSMDERHLLHAIGRRCSGFLAQDEIEPGDLPRLVRLAVKGHRVMSEYVFELFRRSFCRTRRWETGLPLMHRSAPC